MIRHMRDNERDLYNSVVNHPLQSWEWGEFRKLTGQTVERVGVFNQNKLEHGMTVTFHKLPKFGGTVGYYPRGYMPDEDQLSVLRQLGEKQKALFIKLEPNISHPTESSSSFHTLADFLVDHGAVAGRPLFTKYTYQIDLTHTETELFEQCASKTRYNINLAARKGVKIEERSSPAGMQEYIDILAETTRRQGFYAHGPDYFTKMWQTLGPSGILRIFAAVYEGQTLASWIVFVFNKTLYYPYGASRDLHREVMASNLMLWELIRFGKSVGCTKFDLWGALGPKPSSRHPWFGFHRFKSGYNGVHTEFLGTYDYVLKKPMYRVFRVAENWRWRWLRLRARFGV